MHAARRQFDDKERVIRHQPADRPHLGGEEIRGGDRAPVGGQKRTPRHRSLRHWTDPVRAEAVRDRRPRDPMSEVLQGALDSTVAPGGILPRHPDGQLTDLTEHAGASHSPSLSGPLPRDELPMPAQERVRRDQRRHLTQDLAAETVAVHRESTPLGIGQRKASPGKLLFEDAVLFTQVRDDLKLVAIDPARQGDEQNP
jgi:hypothetical protein